jgi:RimJ/RimL family protein N-acetyltransferase
LVSGDRIYEMTNVELSTAGSQAVDNAAKRPERCRLDGAYVRVEPLDASRHGDALWRGCGGASNQDLWRYMTSGPFLDRAAFDAYLEAKTASEEPLYFALADRGSGEAQGHASYMRIDAAQRVIEMGAIVYAPVFQKTRAATEAMYLMIRHVFEELGYRRCEWKCNVLNDASVRAARRLGFALEGVFRQHMIVKGRSRDTAWFAMLDSEWPARKREFARWLEAGNFDAAGRQKTQLSHV